MKRIFSLIVVCLLAVPSSMMAAQDEPISAWDSRFTLLRSPTRQAQQLIAAAEEGHVNTVKELLAAPGINVNTQSNYGTTALIIAALNGYENVVKELLAAPSINVNLQNNYGFSAF